MHARASSHCRQRSGEVLSKACGEISCNRSEISYPTAVDSAVEPKKFSSRHRNVVTTPEDNDHISINFKETESMGVLTRSEEVELAKQMEAGKREILGAVIATPMLTRLLLGLVTDLQSSGYAPNKLVPQLGDDLEPQDDRQRRKVIIHTLKRILSLGRETQKLRASLGYRKRVNAEKRARILTKIQANEQAILDLVENLEPHQQVIDSLVFDFKKRVLQIEHAEQDLIECKRRIQLPYRELSKLARELRAFEPEAKKRCRLEGIDPNEVMSVERVARIAARKRRQALKAAGMTVSMVRAAYQSVLNGENTIEQARHRMVEANIRLVAYVAKRYLGKGVPFSDLVQEGNIGLMRAIDKFDHRMGCKLATYAIYWIRQSVTRAIVDQSRTIRLPLRRVETTNRLFRAAHQLSQKLGREPTCEEMAEKMEMKTKEVLEILDCGIEAVSLDAPLGEEGERHLADWIEDKTAESPSQKAIERDLVEQVQTNLATLNPREERILRMRFGIGELTEYTLEEIGRDFQVSRERIRQIESKALHKLRHSPRYKPLKSFLD